VVDHEYNIVSWSPVIVEHISLCHLWTCHRDRPASAAPTTAPRSHARIDSRPAGRTGQSTIASHHMRQCLECDDLAAASVDDRLESREDSALAEETVKCGRTGARPTGSAR